MLNLTVRIEAASVEGLGMPTEGVPEENIWRDDTGRVAVFLSRSQSLSRICFPGFGVYSFSEGQARNDRMQIVIKPGPTTTRVELIDRLKRNVIPLLLQSRGIQVLHASGVRLGTGIVGLCGGSFSGKSTLAYALGRRGYEVWADDALLIAATSLDIQALKGPPVKVRLRQEAREYFGETRDSLSEPGDLSDKFELSLLPLMREPLKGLCLIERTDKEHSKVWDCTRLSGLTAFKRILAAANYYDLTDATQNHKIAQTCLNVVSRVPIYNCGYRAGFDRLQDVVDHIEAFFQDFGKDT